MMLSALVEENGTLNLNRLYPSSKDTCVQVKCALHVSEAMESELSIGFSDRLRLWVNEKEV